MNPLSCLDGSLSALTVCSMNALPSTLLFQSAFAFPSSTRSRERPPQVRTTLPSTLPTRCPPARDPPVRILRRHRRRAPIDSPPRPPRAKLPCARHPHLRRIQVPGPASEPAGGRGGETSSHLGTGYAANCSEVHLRAGSRPFNFPLARIPSPRWRIRTEPPSPPCRQLRPEGAAS